MVICREYEVILNTANSKRKHIRKIFQDFKRVKDYKKLENLFITHHKHVFEEINCMKCANCCTRISPAVSDKDIQKIASYLGEKPSGITTRYFIMDEDTDYIFRHSPCPFLHENKCVIYEARPKACRKYPHTDHKKVIRILDNMYRNTFICPAVFLVVTRVYNELN